MSNSTSSINIPTTGAGTYSIGAGGGSSSTVSVIGGGGGGGSSTISSGTTSIGAGMFYAPYIPLTSAGSTISISGNGQWSTGIVIDLDSSYSIDYCFKVKENGNEHSVKIAELKEVLLEYYKLKRLAAEFPVVETAYKELNMVVRLHDDVGPSLDINE